MAMFRKEFRVVLPITVEEYQVAQLWSVAEASKNETGGGEGIEVLQNIPYMNDVTGEKGQFTEKIYHLQSRVPGFIRLIAPKGALDIKEEAWNAYPYCKTVITNPDYMSNNFEICIQSLHLPDLGDSENVHKLAAKDWSKTEVVKIDIANDPVGRSDYNQEFDPKLFKSQKSKRGPLGPHWIEQLKAQKHISDGQQNGETKPAYMCAYKLVSCRFKWLGLQKRVESLIQNQERRLFTSFHRQVFCWMDNWFGLTMEQIRELENKTKEDLDKMRKSGQVRGMKVEE